MYQYLHQYFAANKHLSLPNIGHFIAIVTPAESDFIKKSFNAPVYGIVFHRDETVTNDDFAEFLSRQTGKSLQDCIAALNDFSAAIVQKLKTGGEEKLAGIGSLKLLNDGYQFDPNTAVQQFYRPVAAEISERPAATHTVVMVGAEEKTAEQMQVLLNSETKKEQWWVAAAVLTVIGIAAIIYYHWLR